MIPVPVLIFLVGIALFIIVVVFKLDETLINQNNKVKQLNQEIKNLESDKDIVKDEIKNFEKIKQVYTEQIEYLKIEESNYDDNVRELHNIIDKLEEQIELKQSNLDSLHKSLKSQQDVSKEAFSNWFDILSHDYEEKEKEYDLLTDNLKKAYSLQQDKILAEIDKVNAELDKIKKTRDAAIAAARKDQEIKENLSDYCIKLSINDIEDIKRLEEVKKIIHNQRVLSMLIWQTYVSKPLKALAAKVLNSTSPVMGIYKITNTITDECYIGQSVNIAERFVEHAKCGLGIDTPAGNKLYKSMQEYGIHNFSWQLIEVCKREELNEKEKFFINLYNAVEFGLNSSKGIGK